MNDNVGRPTPLMVAVEDSADARVFIEMASFGADLAEAGHALDLAIQGDEEGSPLTEARDFLIGHAVVAYCRSVMPSKVRGMLTDYVDVPLKLVDTHDKVRVFRNRTIAHSQSDLAVTYAVGLLNAGTLEVRGVVSATIGSSLPRSFVRRFRVLVATMEELLDEAMVPVRARLEARLRETDPSELIMRPSPEVVERDADEFNPRSMRPAFPTSHTLYWEPDGDVLPTSI